MEEINKYITPKSGVVAFSLEIDYCNLWKKVKEKFKPYFSWLKKENRNVEDDDLWYYWELFSFEELENHKNEQAIQFFEQLNVYKCYIVQSPVWNNDKRENGFACCLEGQYDTSFINNDEEFYELKEEIRKESLIPYWVIDCIAEHVGRELYVFDEEMKWVLVLTHEKEVFFAELRIKK